ncbi:MAG: hypothetical protein GY780_18375 [bacterium]|nr:hypothetical protein [bacterium]
MGGVVGAQYLDCNTPVSYPDSLVVENKSPDYITSLSSIAIRCYIHVLRETDGSGGLSSVEVDSLFAVASSDFEPLGVMLSLIGQQDLPNSLFYNNPDFYAGDLFSENPHTDAIDIYLGPSSGSAKGRAAGVPSSSMVLTGSLSSRSALSRLLGNCLGLYETDETEFGVENPDGSNAGATGDLVDDTPADPGLVGFVLGDCTLSSSFVSQYPAHSPDPGNIMSNSPMSCWEEFSFKQGARIFAALEYFSVLQGVGAPELPGSAYYDYSEDTLIDDALALHMPKRSNAAAFNFIGDTNKDMVVSGFQSVSSENNGMAFRSDSFTSDGITEFFDVTDFTFDNGSTVISPPKGTVGILVADYDNDGDLDFYAPNAKWDEGSYYSEGHRLYRNNGNGTFSDASTEVFGSNVNNEQTLNGAWGDFDGDGYLDLAVAGSPNSSTFDSDIGAKGLTIYHNQQVQGNDLENRVFVNVTDSIGFPTPTGETYNQMDFRSLFWVDLDQDHDMDLILFDYLQFGDAHPNTRPHPASRYFRNDGGTFSDQSVLLFANRDDLWHGGAFAGPGDFDNDGDIDIVFHARGVAGRRGIFTNHFVETGTASLSLGWSEAPEDQIAPTDLDIFDYNLDGWLDFGISNSALYEWRSRILENTSGGAAFGTRQLNGDTFEAHGLCAADWNLDGFSELMIASEGDAPFFFKNEGAFPGGNPNNWVGIRLRSENLSCNTYGIGATVIVEWAGNVQARVVDGGSGNAGQNDLDLSFGLGAYADTVDVEVIWPCGQTQYERVLPGQYNTLTIGQPTIIRKSVKSYMEWAPGDTLVTWVFEWDTPHPSDISLDEVEFPNGVADGVTTVYSLSSSSPDVVYTVEKIGDKYKHFFKWENRICDQILTVPYIIHSRVLNQHFTWNKTLYVLNCPEVE